MTDDQLLRYSRHILLDALGIEGQARILDTHALIIGAGGLGSPAALYLASAGVGRITLVDDDTVDFTNLQRQIIHTQARVGMAKAESGRQALSAINPEIEIIPLQQRLSGEALDALVASADLVLDCTDNFATRHAINRACVHHRKPLVSGAAIRFGVFAPLTGIIGTMQAAEALKLAADIGETLTGRLLLLDALTMEWRTVRFKKDDDCAVCGPKGNVRSGEYLRQADADRESSAPSCRLA